MSLPEDSLARASDMARRIYIFPGSQPRVREAVDAILQQYGGAPCEPPATEETMFLVGSTAVWKQLTDGHKPRS
ncbi:MAG TPA: hypothetical protein VNJ70_18495 [Thermoanaerobaculia bacterium]|nr:hypothetical protein [Thermoanaerobaculia bacterium]